MTPRPLIVVDPGHGGKDPGAVNAEYGVRESDLNLTLALAFVEASAGACYDTLLLRTTDIDIPLSERARLANESGAMAVLSFHANAAADPSADGFEVWTSPGQTNADFLASSIFVELDAVTGLFGREDYADGDPDKEAHFYILRHTTAPAVLIEFGFLTNDSDVEYLTDPDNQRIIAQAVRQGVEEWAEIMGGKE